MLNSVKHDIQNAHKYKNIKKFGPFLGSVKPRMLIHVKMPIIVSNLTFMSGKVSCSVELSMKKFYILGPRCFPGRDYTRLEVLRYRGKQIRSLTSSFPLINCWKKHEEHRIK